MRNTIANYKESLSRIASDVLDAADDLDLAGSRPGRASSPFAERRSSHRFAQPTSPAVGSPVANGTFPDIGSESEQHKAEIERLQASEAEIKALAVNYAAILKEKEAQLSRLNEENGLLRKSLEAKNGTTTQVRDENLKSPKISSFISKPNQLPSKQHKNTAQVSPHSGGSSSQKNALSRVDAFSNGSVHTAIGIPPTQSQKELDTLLEEKNKALAGIQAQYESEIKELMMELKNEREISAEFKQKSCDEQRRSSSFQKDIHDLKLENERTSAQMKDLQKILDEKVSEISRLQAGMSQKNTEKATDKTFGSLQSSIATLQEENYKLKLEKEKLSAALELEMKNSSEKGNDENSESFQELQKTINKEREEMLVSIQQLEKTLKESCKERDKAQKELARLKKHLLDKELEESEKMDEDSRLIAELRAVFEHQKAHILKLEKALRQEVENQEELRNISSNEIQKSTETVDDLNQKLANYMNIVESKNSELLNLQTALGQYYAESEAKERLERDLAAAKEESAKLLDSLKVAKQDCQLLAKEKEDTTSKLLQAERMLSESKCTIQKLQEDNSKLHRAVEQSMTRINRMSMDSDFYVDRRIVIKLLVTYFQRNHSREVLDLMVRMLGFSDEDKQRIGFAQQNAGKGAVRGVLGLPGRLVGGIFRGNAPISSKVPSENQSFADLWVDFLLKEAEQRERRESEAVDQPSSMEEKRLAATTELLRTSAPDISSSPIQYSSPDRFSLSRQNHLLESYSEFATVPLTSSASPSTEGSARLSLLLQR